MNYELAFIGAGNMAEAIARGLIEAGLLEPGRIIAADPAPSQLARFQARGIATTPSNAQAAAQARIVLLAVKPQVMEQVLGDIGPALSPAQLIVSIAAGVRTAAIESRLPAGARVVRAMPNTPILVGLGATAVCRGAHATCDDLAAARNLFESASAVIEVPEELMNAVTAVSGSGPAYFFYLAEHLLAAAIRLGLTPQQASVLVRRTASGAARLLESSGDGPEALRERVTSPGGTTQAAMELLESIGVGRAIEAAVFAAERRGRELGG